ncbi:protein NUCLEAR FUSION DEFECTIVE 4 [Canna indica]|uniref:Protein NUCLEAR FUSION DEFECTIVE 4 n=1 Tax=Canna indica TaxID=4628 RepID=A0AAQ3L0F3_9LILI|nr:protein NUCLEAR FUSION DEFECTIVE 4 [Canna indica]
MSSSSLQWLSLIATIWLQTFNGANTDFPVYSSELKDLKRISQVGINFLAFASDAGKLFGWLSGLAAMHLPLWLVAIVGAALGLLGYGLQFLFLEKPHFSYPHIFLLTALAGNGICWINTACYLICIKNFASHSRIAVGLSTSYVGLSAKVYTVLAGAIFYRKKSLRKAKEYLLLNAAFPLLAAAIVAPFLRLISSKNNVTRFDIGFVVMFVITFATGVSAIVGSIGSTSRGIFTREYALSLGLLLASPLVVPLAMKLREVMEETWWSKKENRVHDLTVADDVEVGEGEDLQDQAKNDMAEEEEEEKESEEEVGGLLILRKVDFWLYFFSYLFSATLGLVFLNNLGQIAESRGLEREETSTLVSLSSSFGFFGRLLPFLLDYYSSKRKLMISRPASMATLMAPMAGAFFVLLNPSRLCLYISTAIIGAFTGAITSIAVSATTELFGTKHFSVNHNIVVTNIPLGSFVFGYLAALLYQRGVEEGSHVCRGAACYGKTFIVWGATCSLGCILCTALYMRTRTPKPCRSRSEQT